MSNLVGQSLGRYHILEQLGEGGMAIVYKAYDTRLETDVAVKIIRTERLSPEILQRALKRFEREAKSLAQLTHPNLVKVLDYGEYEGKPYLVMPFLPGGTLKQLMKGKPYPWRDAARLLIPIARALDYAHKRNLIHRDVKPSNILITESGEPMLTDFGVVKIIDEEATLDLTGTSAAVGTPEYMAPEQATAKNIDHRVDIYSLGIVFYELITNRRPFEADTPMAVLFKHASEPLPSPNLYVKELPASVENVLLKMLSKRPNDRYQSMGELVSELEMLAIKGADFAPVKRYEKKAKDTMETKEEPKAYNETYGLINFRQWIIWSTVWWMIVEMVGWFSVGIDLDESLVLVEGVGSVILYFGQWLILRNQQKKSGWLILFGAIGWALGLSSCLLLLEMDKAFINFSGGLFVGALVGLFIGLGQLVVFKNSRKRSTFVILSNVCIWGLALGSAWGIFARFSHTVIPLLNEAFIGFAISGGMTGAFIGSMIGTASAISLSIVLDIPDSQKKKTWLPWLRLPVGVGLVLLVWLMFQPCSGLDIAFKKSGCVQILSIPGSSHGKGTSVVFSQDSSLLAYATEEGYYDTFIEVRNIKDGSLIQTIENRNINGEIKMAFSPTNEILAVLDTVNQKVRLWRIADGALMESMSVIGRISDIAYYPDGTLMGFSANNVFDVLDGNLLGTLIGGNFVSSLDGALVNSSQGEYWILERTTDRYIINKFDYQNAGYSSYKSFSFSPNGDLLAATNSDAVDIWRVADGILLLKSFKGPINSVSNLIVSPDGKLLATVTGYDDRVLIIWDLESIFIAGYSAPIPTLTPVYPTQPYWLTTATETPIISPELSPIPTP
jgi:tRNA A-37 threonylcarbamoyl transferase component Bud32